MGNNKNKNRLITKEIRDVLVDEDTLMTLTTVWEGVPHTVCKIIRVMNNNNISYVELSPLSVTQRNMTKNIFFENGLVSIGVFNRKKNVYLEIKARPKKMWMDGPIFQEALDWAWSKWPNADPDCLWELTPVEIRSLDILEGFRRQYAKNPAGVGEFRYYGPRPGVNIK